MAGRVTSNRLIGRAVELAELEAALDETRQGRGALAFVAGESGVGKTRLVSELQSRARDAGARVLVGDCVELGEGELPYAPLVAALRPLARDGDPVLQALPASARTELATLLPEIGTPAQRSRADEERGAAQLRLFEALLGLLDRLAAAAPLVLVLEDIHWADRSTRAFLTFLAASLAGERILVVLTYRSDELHRRHPLRPLLAELERAPGAHRIELPRLDRAELASQLEDILGEPAAPELLDRLYRRSEGNPLFAEELLAAGTDGRGALPPTMREALMVRVERLSPTAQEVLRVLATAGRADHQLLADASGLDARDLREALREGAAGQIVVADDEGRYGFRHALLREVVYDDLLPGEHAELHLTLARALERRAEERTGAWVSAGIAHHYLAAGDQPAALRASVVAAAEAERVHAHGEEAALLERALELWDRVPEAAGLAGAERQEIFARAGRAHVLSGDDGRAVTLLERALVTLEGALDHRQLAVLLGALASAYRHLGRGEDGRRTLRRALDLVAGDGPTPERIGLLVERVVSLMLQGRHRECVEAAREALATASAAADEAARGQILNRLGVTLFAIGEEQEGTAALREAIDLAARFDDQDGRATAFLNLADALDLGGRTREAQAILREGEVGVDPETRAARWIALCDAGFAFELGDWERAATCIPARIAGHSGVTVVNEDLRRAELALGRGDHDEARPLVDELDLLLRTSLEPQYIAPAAVLRAELERRSGDLAAARAAVEDALDRIEFCSEDAFRLAGVAAAGAEVEADAAQRARDLGDDEAERGAVARAEAHLERLRAAAGDAGPVEAALLAGAEADMDRARTIAADPGLWVAAAEAWTALERPYPADRARWREAEAHMAAGDRGAAGCAAQAALASARRLGAGWLEGEVEALVARGRLRVEGDAPAARSDARASDDPFGLTPRERQVLALVADGATNREIGAQLFMAEKTASVHVSRILAKLAVRSRTEAAAVAHRHALT